MKAIALLGVLLATAFARGAEARPTEYYDPDVQRLIKVQMFAFGGVGLGGGISQGEASFGAIVRKQGAIRYIMAAFEYGSTPARCYALIALRESSPVLFRAALSAIRKRPPEKLRTASGCLVMERDAKGILDAIEAGAYASEFKRHEERG